jgi:uncharacterized protein YhfF
MGPAPAVYMNKKGKNNLEERRSDLAVLEKGYRSLKSWRKEMALSLGEGDENLQCWRKEIGSQNWRQELDHAILEKGDGGPCGVGERRWALSLGDRS